MSYVKLGVHAVWGTKNRFPFLQPKIMLVMLDHIYSNAKHKGIYIDRLNGASDHLHCLFYLNLDMTLMKAMQLIKGESSHWINKQELINDHFEWADEYSAVSVGESEMYSIRAYIDNQQEHHRKKTFAEECDEFLAKYGFVKMKDFPQG